ncbi:MAG: hypothetical protein DI622_08870 [Chryseobacterium sp.]|nr:MAG: hypothetical protein DI622_08870 [Chryseobacterium sp.]
MDNCINDLINLLSDKITEIQSDAVIVKVIIDDEILKQIRQFYNDDLIENIKDSSGSLINIDNVSVSSQTVFIEFVTAELKKKGYYITFADFIVDNRFEADETFYIQELNYNNESSGNHEKIEKYKTLLELIQKLILKSKFVKDEDVKTLFLFQENKFIELPIDNGIVYEDSLQSENIGLVEEYVKNIDEYKEKRSIFLQELIDFLSPERSNRFKYLLSNFKEFFERCNTSFEFYLSNFSYNKVKMEIDNSVFEHSKNIRNIINDAQSKLIAIPAAFVLAATQIDFSNVISIKNIIIIASSFIFSYIISIFIQNQKNALNIVSENVKNYKKSFLQTKADDMPQAKGLPSISKLLKDSYEKIESELINQKTKLRILQFIGWAISAILVISLPIAKYQQEIKSIFEYTECTKVGKPIKMDSKIKTDKPVPISNKTK